jgi:hypothetical protein
MYFLLGLIIEIGLTIFRGFVFMKLWLWFVVPTFAAAALNIPQAIGISLIVGFLTIRSMNTSPQDGKTLVERSIEPMTAWAVFYTIVLISGFVTKQFL